MTTTTTTCPAWCNGHRENHPHPYLHRSAEWSGKGLTVSVERDDSPGAAYAGNPGPFIEVDYRAREESLSLTPEQAHELGMELVRAADRIRRRLSERLQYLRERGYVQVGPFLFTTWESYSASERNAFKNGAECQRFGLLKNGFGPAFD